MGAFGDERTTGKPVGGDLREGKPTPLLARALAAATPSQHEVLATVGQPEMSDDDNAAIQTVLVETGALADLEATIAELTAEAIAAIDDAGLGRQATDELIVLAEFVSQREL
jgi:geranylgeranyl diphosphate synthase type I